MAPAASGFLTQDEEASGVIPLKGILGPNWYLIDLQAHYSITGELVEGGQLLAMRIPSLGRDDDEDEDRGEREDD